MGTWILFSGKAASPLSDGVLKTATAAIAVPSSKTSMRASVTILVRFMITSQKALIYGPPTGKVGESIQEHSIIL